LYVLSGRPEKGGLCVRLKKGGFVGVPGFVDSPVSLAFRVATSVVIPGAEISAVALPEVENPGVETLKAERSPSGYPGA